MGGGIVATKPRLKPTLSSDFVVFFLATGLATLRELKEVYSYKDANAIWEVYEVDSINSRRDMAAAETKARILKGR